MIPKTVIVATDDHIRAMILDLPNKASVAEFAVNYQLEESF
ncbi:hypothetical protein [Paracoccus laeviglucosivorans]|uniref:Uncharacterized protein n=1 Tax=Paracoccus laeviglucosivorans TaxID=1197861 RepID=A0A521EU47_9RHOB|nr:hypothetical protein [Paracoccus laeviglucosivorans]SMO87442.1 hypothetical protein SAMN06265221_11589 [Paracoccus laeviglucosivorans]